MITSVARRAASSHIPLTLSQASAQLIPPLPLYRRLLRAHRLLPVEMRFMGDSYVKSEFRLTRSADNPLHIIAFLSQWKLYLDQLEEGGGKAWRGRKLDTEALDALNSEQVGQLYELMHAAEDVWKTPAQLEQEAQVAESNSVDLIGDDGKGKS